MSCNNNNEQNNEQNNKKKVIKQEDKLYTRIYENEIDRQGFDICLDKCNGYCVEYGIMGKAFCFENQTDDIKN